MKGYLIKWWKTAWREWEKPIGGDLNDENKLTTWKAGGRSFHIEQNWYIWKAEKRTTWLKGSKEGVWRSWRDRGEPLHETLLTMVRWSLMVSRWRVLNRRVISDFWFQNIIQSYLQIVSERTKWKQGNQLEFWESSDLTKMVALEMERSWLIWNTLEGSTESMWWWIQYMGKGE